MGKLTNKDKQTINIVNHCYERMGVQMQDIENAFEIKRPVNLNKYIHVCIYSFTQACLTVCNSMDQVPLSMEFFQARILEWFPLPPPGDLPNPGIKPKSSASPALAGGFFSTEPPWKIYIYIYRCMYIHVYVVCVQTAITKNS